MKTTLAKTAKLEKTSDLEDFGRKIELYNYNNDGQYEYENESNIDDLDEQEQSDELKRKYDEYNQRENQSNIDDDDGLYSSRSFALALIGIASLYVLVMICQAYKNNQNRVDLSESDQYEIYGSEYYEYETQSYDFAPYQSAGTNDVVGVQREFNYNQSIDGSKASSHQSDQRYANSRRRHKRVSNNRDMHPSANKDMHN